MRSSRDTNPNGPLSFPSCHRQQKRMEAAIITVLLGHEFALQLLYSSCKFVWSVVWKPELLFLKLSRGSVIHISCKLV